MQNIHQKASKHAASKGGKLPMWKAMLQCKCPVCTEGNMFKTSATNLKHFNELQSQCKVCGFRFMPEPGFYQISLYFTYTVNVAIYLVFGFAAFFLLDDAPMWVYIALTITPAIVAVPWNLRYSKVIMLYIFGDAWHS